MQINLAKMFSSSHSLVHQRPKLIVGACNSDACFFSPDKRNPPFPKINCPTLKLRIGTSYSFGEILDQTLINEAKLEMDDGTNLAVCPPRNQPFLASLGSTNLDHTRKKPKSECNTENKLPGRIA